jgi:hypothetical protein
MSIKILFFTIAMAALMGALLKESFFELNSTDSFSTFEK